MKTAMSKSKGFFKGTVLLTSIVLSLFLGTISWAGSSNNTHRLVQDHINSGGTTASANSIVSIHSVGQPVYGHFSSSGYQMKAGFLLAISNIVNLRGDVNGDGAVNIEDLIIGLLILTGGNPVGVSTTGDVNDDNRIGLEEVLHDLKTISEQ